jgi:amino acid transporter
MKNSYKQLGASVIAALFLFSSCSRELTSIPHTNKLANVQTLEKQNTIVQKTEPTALVQPVTPSLLPPATDPCVTTPASSKTIKVAQTQVSHHSFASIFPKQAGKEILKQANNVRHLSSPNQLASYSKTTHTESWLGLAIVCLIVGVVLAILGFAELGALFWAIGIVILVVAIIFFILYLLAEAVNG